MKLTDEILNKYLDGELSSNELKKLNTLIENDPDALATVKMHKFVDQTLSGIQTDSAPEGFTHKVMNLILPASSVKYQKNYFFRTIVTLFGLLIVGVLVSAYFITASSSSDPGMISQTAESIGSFFADNFSSLSKFTSSKLMIFIGGFLTSVLIVIGYFVLENHKAFKQKLESSFH